MSDAGFATISRSELQKRLERTCPYNEHRERGFALVNVLHQEEFERERIPGSANVPRARADEFEERFDKTKEIVVYCASPECDASAQAARELVRRGFERVIEYAGGMRDWRDAGQPVAGSAS